MTSDISSKVIETDLVETAVKFLQNPSIINNPFNEKKNFLKRKGLTDEQIRSAFEKSGSLDIAVQSINNTHFYSSDAHRTTNSFLANFRNSIYSSVFIGCLLYGLYLLYKNFIKTYFSNESDSDDINNEIRNFTSTNNNNNQIVKLTDSLKEFQSQLNHISTKVEQLNSLLDNSKSFDHKFKEIKDEINTIKGLLLNRKQFPKIPINTAPSMPDWQLESLKEKLHASEVDNENGNQLSKKSSFDSSGSSEDIEAHAKHSDSSIEMV